MKLEPVLTIKIVDHFVRFGMPYRLQFYIHFAKLEAKMAWE